MGGSAEVRVAVRKLLEAGKIILPDALDILQSVENPLELVQTILNSNPNIEEISKETLGNINATAGENPIQIKPKIKPTYRKKSRILSLLKKPKESIQNYSVIQTSLDDLHGLHNYEPDLKIVREPNLSSNLTGEIEDIVGYFQDRYLKLSRIFYSRSDISNLVKIKDIGRDQSEISVIGMLTDKIFPNKKSGRLLLEDPSSNKMIEAVIYDNPTLVDQCIQIMLDSVICVQGSVRNGTFFIHDVLLPDIPHHRDPNFASIPVHVAFLSDIHIGSKNFLEKPLTRFIEFLNGEYGDKKMRQLGSQTKYVLFSGDVVDGVGIYPNQLDDLSIESITDQYSVFAEFIDKIPDDVQIVIIPGNHDMVRSAEPQPRIPPEYAPDLESFNNVHLLPNPSQVSLHGVQTLLYHCTSLPDILNHIPGIPVNKPVEVMKHMLKARHLAPIWGEKTPIAAEVEDHLVIDPIPDIFHGGHIHINGEGSYRGVRIVNSGTMQSQTSYQKSLNILPTPGQVTIMNLKDHKMSKIDFLKAKF